LLAGSAGEVKSTAFKVDLQHKVHCGNARGQSSYLENQKQGSQGAGDFITWMPVKTKEAQDGSDLS